MPTSRRLPASYNISTYDSGGGRDYSSLALWEAATDNDLVAAAKGEVLDCYRGAHEDGHGLALSGATTSRDYFRVIRAAPGEGHRGMPVSDGSCVAFHSSTFTQYMLYLGEDYAALHDLVLSADPTADNQTYIIRMGYTGCAVAGCLLYDSVNHGLGSINGIIAWLASDGAGFVVNTLVHNMDRDGIDTWTGTLHVTNCTVTGNGRYGMYGSFGQGVAKNVCVSGNTADDWYGDWSPVTSTAEGASPTYQDPAADDFRLSGADTTCRDLATDLSADPLYPFDDDVTGATREPPWDIGFHEVLFVPDIFAGWLSVTMTARLPGMSIQARAAALAISARAPAITFRLNDD